MRKPGAIPEGAAWCNRCRRVKPLGAFYSWPSHRGRSTYCRACSRLCRCEYARSGLGLATLRAYRSRPEVKAGAEARKADPDFREAVKAAHTRYRTSPVGKLLRRRQDVRRRLRNAPTERVRRNQKRRLAEVEAELARIGWRPRGQRREAG